MLLTAFGGNETSLFHAVAAESQSFPTIYTVDQSQFAYDLLVERAGCGDQEDTLACLRKLDTKDLQNANKKQPLPGRKNAVTFQYSTTIDGDFLTDIPYKLYAEGKFVKVPSIFGWASAQIMHFNIFLRLL